LVSNYAYQNDTLSRRKNVILTGTQAGGSRHIRFAYDDRNELSEAKWYTDSNTNSNIDPDSTANPITGRQFTYTFDPIGNRTQDTGDPTNNTTTWNPNSLNEYTSTTNPSESFTYDDDGNVTQDALRTYTWDAENRLIESASITLNSLATKVKF